MLLCPASFFPDPLLDHTFQVHSGLFLHLLPDVDADVGGGLAVSKAEDAQGYSLAIFPKDHPCCFMPETEHIASTAGGGYIADRAPIAAASA